MLMLNTKYLGILGNYQNDSNTTYVNVKLYVRWKEKYKNVHSNTTYVNVKRDELVKIGLALPVFKYNLC